MKKTKTMDIQGKEYSKVKERLKLFREENSRGVVETEHTLSDSQLIWKATIKKDASDPGTAIATGHSMKKLSGDVSEKVFEKQETIAVGRALANLGYAADGEIASSEEIEEFEEHKQEKFMEDQGEWVDKLQACKTLEELQKAWVAVPPIHKQPLNTIKNELKLKLNEDTKNTTEQPRVAGVAKGKGNGKQSKGNTSKKR